MTLFEIMDILDAKCLVGRKQLNMEVETAFSADLLSDVLAFAKAGSLLLTGLTNPQIVRTASILDIAAIILVRGKIAPDETLRMADELEIPMLSTRYILFETSGRLFMNGIKGCVERVGSDTYVTL
ncbi:MAG: transcriptional regulator [Deltaproteobacteria bacterium]|nr:transcriptional regulator [Deltaproteobacteria bacterium]MBN2686860.1 transcriptional regulator [Deltaproteobacteria bacterium]